MEPAALYSMAADAVLFVHALFIVFIVLGLVLVLTGKLRSWQWVRNPWFRLFHLLGIAVVVLQSWFGVICPLTSWEMSLRSKAAETVYDGSFIAYWLGKLVYYQASPWVFMVAYTVFGSLVLLSWFLVPPRRLFGALPGSKPRQPL